VGGGSQSGGRLSVVRVTVVPVPVVRVSVVRVTVVPVPVVRVSVVPVPAIRRNPQLLTFAA